MAGQVVNHNFFILLFLVINFVHGRDVIIKEDQPYEVIKFSFPRNVWKEALKPTPVLKSQVTITLPVNVGDEDNLVDEYEDEVIEDEFETTTVGLSEEQVIQNDTIAAIQNDTLAVTQTPPANVTQNPALDEGVTSTESDEVAGEVQRFPCSCNGQCGCCTGAILQRFNLKACGNISFIPEDFVFDVRLTVNNQTVVRQKVSASDPPPVCFNPRRAPFVRVCAEISNIRIRNRNAFACLDINADIGGFQIYSASFRCFGLGSKGVQTGLKPKKPISGGPKPVNLFGSSSSSNNAPTLLQNAAGALLGGSGGLFGGGGSPGPLGALGNAVGGLFE